MKKKDSEDFYLLDLLKKWELIEMVLDMEKTILKYEKALGIVWGKERDETKQRPIPDDWRINK